MPDLIERLMRSPPSPGHNHQLACRYRYGTLTIALIVTVPVDKSNFDATIHKLAKDIQIFAQHKIAGGSIP